MESDFLPLMIKHFGSPIRTETLTNNPDIHDVQWCQTAKGGMNLSAENPQVKTWRNAGPSAEVINTFSINFDLVNGKDQYCR